MNTAVVKSKKVLCGVKISGSSLTGYLDGHEIYFDTPTKEGQEYFFITEDDVVTFIIGNKTYTADQVTIQIEEK